MRLIAAIGAVLAIVVAPAAFAAQPLRTGFLDPGAFSGPAAKTSIARAHRAGASLERIFLVWNSVAPVAPAHPEDPDDPAYQWQPFDEQIVNAVRGGLDPLVYISGSARWARGSAVGLPGTWPSPTQFGQFARAAARRYSGTFRPTGSSTRLPRVRFWQAWNEPNAGRELSPQRVNGKPVSPAHYRRMVNAFASAIHDVKADNLVIAGALGPFAHDSKDIQVVAPMSFMSALLCVSQTPPHRRTCSQPTRFDVWAHNPYTNGGPNRHARARNDASIGDLPEMRELLIAAKRNGTIISAHQPQFWVTEFSWDTKPPDPKGVPSKVHARWVSEALYRMWRAGVSAVIWFRLRDDPLRETPYQSGFFTASGAPKYSLEAFRFPFVAFPTGRTVSIWGRVPPQRSGPVIVQQKLLRRWVVVARLRGDRNGIFSAKLATGPTTALRARLASSGEVSLPFTLAAPPPRPTTPFGCGGAIPC